MSTAHVPGTDKPLRAGVYSSTQAADRAIAGLLSAGFTKDEITVVCAHGPEHEHFKPFEHQEPAGTYTPAAAVAGGALGAAIGGLTALAGAMTGGIALLAAGGILAWSGGVVGGLVGAMMTRGVDKELANYYNQSVLEGKILVAAECHGPNSEARQARAAQILADAGAEPIALAEG